jgi:hypothetical protein
LPDIGLRLHHELGLLVHDPVHDREHQERSGGHEAEEDDAAQDAARVGD